MVALLRTTQIQEPSSATVNMTNDTLGNTAFGGMPYGTSSFLRNRIINGNMQVWQRGTSFTGSGSISYTADRWCNIQYSGSTPTISQVTSIGLAGFQYALRIQRTSGNTNTASLNLSQSIETLNCYDLAGQSITLSFYARVGANYSGTTGVRSYIATGTGTDQNIYGTYTGSVATAQTNSTTTSWQKFTQTITVPSNATEIAIYFDNSACSGTAGAADYYDITGVQLEQGSVATPFERPLISKQLADCQRYLPAWSSTSAGATALTFGNASSTTNGKFSLPFPVSVRTPPTGVVISSAAHFFEFQTGSVITCTGITFNSSTYLSGAVDATVASGLTSGGCTMFGPQSTSALLYFTGCEL